MTKPAMSGKINTKQLDLAFDLIQGINKLSYEYIYRGKFTKNITANLLALTETNLEKAEDTQKLKKKIYFVMVECLQNITKHQDKVKDSLGEESAILVLQKRDKRYYITTGNVIEKTNIEKLAGMLEKVNAMDSDELKLYYQEMLVTGEISTKGGAGLGLIAMARKTGNKLLYDFQHVDDKISYFYLRTEIPLEKAVELPHKSGDWRSSFDKIKKIHTILIKEDILLNFNGTFDRDNLINLLPIIDAQMHGTIDFKKRVFKIMFEMLHNIVSYSEDATSKNRSIGENEGIFLLSRHDDKFYFTAGNYIHNSKIKILQDKINFVNNLKDNEILDFYKKISIYFEKEEIKKPDLSIIEMRLKSGNQLNCKFSEVSENYSFFSLQASIHAKKEV
ncbi:MAG: SiaB family protein kinase [Bacteroidales bacterium]|nr:SiaB family protein kinase [Bacteroidales bacterium]